VTRRTVTELAMLEVGHVAPVSRDEKLRRRVWRLRASSLSLSVATAAYARANRKLAARVEVKP
jgi:hypothetical protein